MVAKWFTQGLVENGLYMGWWMMVQVKACEWWCRERLTEDGLDGEGSHGLHLTPGNGEGSHGLYLTPIKEEGLHGLHLTPEKGEGSRGLHLTPGNRKGSYGLQLTPGTLSYKINVSCLCHFLSRSLICD